MSSTTYFIHELVIWCLKLFCLISFVSFYDVSAENVDISKRQTNLPQCMMNFDIYEDKIIRTKDSKALGAKFINESDVPNRESCMKNCCETENCDVFIFEEKSPGSCYLFECGSSEDFKCKFTKHRNYTSAVLSLSKHLTELQTLKLSQQENQLYSLRDGEKSKQAESGLVAVAASPKTTLPSPGDKETLQVVPSPPSLHDKRCSHYQFECRTSHECIAIYNACDGIAQCADGSDEAPELGCPTPPVSSSKDVSVKVEKEGSGGRSPYPADTLDAAPHPPSHSGDDADTNRRLASQRGRVGYGREGEGMSQYHPQDMPYAYQYPNNPGGSQIFSHKGGLMSQNERYPVGHPGYQDVQSNMMMGGYNEVPNDYNKYYEMQQLRMNNLQMQYPPWQSQLHRPNDMNSGVGGAMGQVPPSRYVGTGLLNQDYYYDDSLRQPPHHSDANAHSELSSLKSTKVDEPRVAEKVPVSTQAVPIPTTTQPHHPSNKAKEPEVRHHISQIKYEKLTADSAYSVLSTDARSVSPNGAILSLTFGLLLTGIMVVLVGCRLRTVHRRLRKGAKSFAHDADFLVNGMYL